MSPDTLPSVDNNPNPRRETMESPYRGQPHIPPQVFNRMREIEGKIDKKIALTVNSDMTGSVLVSGLGERPIPFADLNQLYASVEVVADLHNV